MEGRADSMTDRGETIRTFIALPLPADWTEALGFVISELQNAMPSGVRWVAPSGIHLTLKFLGSTDPGLADRIIAALGRQFDAPAVPQLTLAGLGTFPTGRNPRVIWAGVSGDLMSLDALHQRAEEAAGGLGWPAEKRPFRPHLTLGRVRDRVSARHRQGIAEVVARSFLPATASWRPDTVRLYRSELTPRGAIYTSLGDIKF